MWFLGRQVKVSSTAHSELGRIHRDEYGRIEQQLGTIREGIRRYTARLDSGEVIDLQPDEVEIQS
jgi:hypothetical protein